MGSRQTLKLQLYSSGSLPVPVLPEKLACSPVLDLLAAADSDNAFFIRRANAEQVSKPAQISGAEILAMRWKPDGQYVAVAWSDGVVRLTGIESTKALHQISPRESPQARIEYLGWSRNWTGKAHLRLSKGPQSTTLADLVPGALDGLGPDERTDVLDLPREITFLDVETSLPKLSPLPVSGGTGEDTFVFSSRTSLEFVFKPFKPEEADQVDVMITGMVDGSMRLTIYDTFDVGQFRYMLPSATPQAAEQQRPLRLVCHGSHPAVSSHSLLLRAGDSTPETLYLVPMDLYFVYSSPINLSLLASKVTILQKILRYIHQTQVHMASEWASARDLPARFLRNVSEDLAQSTEGPKSVMQALYHTVLTGHAHPLVKDWLVDSVAERGHKRWDKAVTTGLENIRALIHENMIPALERCAIILSRLLGLARFHDGGRSDVGFSAAKISRLLEIISCLMLVCHKVLVHVMDELELFGMFSSWLRFQIDRLASSTSSAADDLSEREATMDNGKVLGYISGFLMQSPAATFFGAPDPESFREDQALADGGLPLLDAVEEHIRLTENEEAHMRALPRVDFLVQHLRAKAQGVFDDIAEAERRNVHFGSPTALAVGGPVAKQEMSMCSLPRHDGVDAQTYTVLSRRDQEGALYIFRTKIATFDGISTEVATDVCAVALTGGKLVDFRFLTDDVLLVLWQPEEKGTSPFIFRLSLKAQSDRFSAYTEGTPPTTREVSVGDLAAGSPRMDVSGGAGGGRGAFRPVWMEVKRPSSGRGRMPARVCLLGSDRVTYKVFAIPDDLEADGA